MSILGSFSINRLALAANSKAIQITSHNVANINTPGYTRQEAVFSSTLPQNGLPGQVGTGVQITKIQRIVNEGIERQLIGAQSSLGQFEAAGEALARIEATLASVDGGKIGGSLNAFFNALRDVSTRPAGLAERTILLNEADAVAERFQDTAIEFGRVQGDIERQVQELLSSVNIQADQIAQLNGQINLAVISGQEPNDLLDQRTQAISELAENIDVTTVQGANGDLSVFVAEGFPLVSGVLASSLDSVVNLENAGKIDIRFNQNEVVTGRISSGRLGGLIDVRDTILPDLQKQVDQLAATVINEVNQQHRVGFGLDGTTSNDFFAPLSVTASASSTNTGTGAVVGVISNAAALTFDDYQVSFAAGNYTFTNVDTGASTTAAYVNPSVVTFEGLQLTISGAPLAGDTFSVSTHDGAAAQMAVAVTNTDKIAASATALGVPGDNLNVLALVTVQDKAMAPLNGRTLNTFASSISGSIGSSARANQQKLQGQQLLTDQIQQIRDTVSGVSLDEEMIKLIQFQQVFQAAARLITVADELFETLNNLKR